MLHSWDKVLILLGSDVSPKNTDLYISDHPILKALGNRRHEAET